MYRKDFPFNEQGILIGGGGGWLLSSEGNFSTGLIVLGGGGGTFPGVNIQGVIVLIRKICVVF